MPSQQPILTLPIDARIPEIRKSVHDFSNVIILAEPGAGKSTRVPPALMNDASFGQGSWIMLQPRRWAAKQVAKRIAEEQGVRLGDEVGYQVRFDSKTSAKTRLTILTEGILLRKLVQDPELNGVAGVILDEFHERSLDLDLALAILKEIQESLRPDLKIVVMSATLDPAALERYLPSVTTVRVEGRTFPVEKKYLGNVNVANAVSQALDETDGDVLVFLPGAYEIERAVRDVSERHSGDRNLEVLPLYSSLSDQEQRRIFEPSSRRRVICATNIAETSITLPKIKAVVDSGWGKVMRTDPQMGEDRLETLRISRASSEQRAGRAGRVSAGVCYRLWTEAEQMQLRNFETPEVHRVNLSKAILFLADYGVTQFEKFSWFELPKSSMLQWALRELTQFGFLKDGKITERGQVALRFPLSPKFAQLVMVAEAQGQKAFAARMCAYLENRPALDEVEDESVLLRKLNQLQGPAKMSAEQIFGSAAGERGVPTLPSDDLSIYQKILIEAWPEQVFIDGRRVGRRRVVFKKGALPKLGFILNSMEKVEKGSPQIEVRSFIPLDLSVVQARLVKRKKEFWDESAEKVRAQEGLFFEDLEMGELREVQADPSHAGRVLREFILKSPEEIFKRQERFAHWLERVNFYNSTRKDGEGRVEWSWENVLDSLGDGKTKLSQVLEEPIVDYIEGMIDSDLVSRFHESVPEKIEVPSGVSHRVDYSGDVPKLSVRLQEVFGWLDTPRIADGRKGLLMELLSPGFKPIQLTSDLRSFWANAYFEVRRELKIRYPKHLWPEDPLTAKAEAKGRRRF